MKYIFLVISYFCISYITGDEIIHLRRFYLCYLVVLLRKVIIHLESIVEPFVSKNQKEIFAIWVWLGRKSWKRVEAMEKSTHELKADFVYLILWERKINSFEITVINFKYLRNVNLLLKKNFKSAELLTKGSFFLYIRDSPKYGEGNKQRRRRKYTRQSN